MRKILFLLLVAIFLGFFLFNKIKSQVKHDLSQTVPYPSATPVPTNDSKAVTGPSKRSLFVPYWTLGSGEIEGDFDQLLYFGITPVSGRINKSEEGYKNIDKFLSIAPENTKKQLVLRMLNADDTFPILKDSAKQNSLIKDSISIAKENGFDGIVLDLEISAVPFESLIKQINDFTKEFYSQTKNSGLTLSIMFYGDNFYRLRPFDVKTLSGNADSFMIMAYDFHKARSNPGPNFPLRGQEIYGYDMTRMSQDFLKYLPTDKTSVVFGFFGYDWVVDDKGNALAPASAKTYQEIKKEFLTDCTHKDCVIKRKNDSMETEIRYTDAENKKHVVWFEDEKSVKEKEKHLKEKGINSFSSWANSYF